VSTCTWSWSPSLPSYSSSLNLLSHFQISSFPF
jgi:hypothetical protein